MASRLLGRNQGVPIIDALVLFLAISALACGPAERVGGVVPPTLDVGPDISKSGTQGGWEQVQRSDSSLTPNHLWVDAASGDDEHDGLSPTHALRTIQKAADLAGPGTTVHIMSGVYRETVRPAMSGSAGEPIIYLAENGPGSAVIRGSGPSSSLTWSQLETNTIGLPPGVDPQSIYYADLSGWDPDAAPRFLVHLDSSGEVAARLPLAREPDWHVATDWKHHEFWWSADGGSSVASCYPPMDPDPEDCDYGSRSTTQLTDVNDDTDPAGVENGNLSTLGDLTGATIMVVDSKQGHYIYRRTVLSHNVSAGRITVDELCEHDTGSGDPGLGWGSKYFVEGKPYLLDTPGEWWYDDITEQLYFWPPVGVIPAEANIEISVRNAGFDIADRSYLTLDGLTLEFFNGSAVSQSNSRGQKSYHNTVRNATLRYATVGVDLRQSADGKADEITDSFTLENSEVAYMDTLAFFSDYWWGGGSSPDSFEHAGIVNTVIQNNEIHHVGFRSDSESDVGIGLLFRRADRLRLEGNHVHDIAHNGIVIFRSIIQSPKKWGFTAEEIKTGEILVKDNVFESACQLTTDCGALKFAGSRPDGHVFRDVLVTGNVFRNTLGWAFVSEKRGLWSGGTASEVQGMGGRGLYVDNASGIHAYRNITYNNAFAGFFLYGAWRDGDIVYYNNVAANSLYGFRFGGLSLDTHASVNTQVVNNMVVNHEAHGIWHADADGVFANTVIDHNLYYNNGWRAYDDGGVWMAGAMAVSRGPNPNEYYQTLAEIQANTAWESHGVEGDPGFWDYEPDDHDLDDGSWPNFHIPPASVNAVDRGAADLPASLTRLLAVFQVDDTRFGSAFDIGRYEAAGVRATPSTRAVEPGDTAQYALTVYPPSFPDSLDLVVASPPAELTVEPSSALLEPGETSTLTITDNHDPGTELMPGLLYVITLAATHGEATQYTDVRLLVGGAGVHMPFVVKRWP